MSTYTQADNTPATIPLMIFPALGLIAVGALFALEMPWVSVPAVVAISGLGWGALTQIGRASCRERV